jgi:fatty acid/phospholipid biosynthesis enzyme
LRPDPSAGERHEDLQEQLKPSNGGVFLGLNGIVIKSHAGSTPRVSQTLSIWLPKMALQELHSKSGRQ